MDEIEGRLDLFDERLDHYQDRLEALEEAQDGHHARMINWTMLGLFVIEVVIGAAELWMMRHA